MLKNKKYYILHIMLILISAMLNLSLYAQTANLYSTENGLASSFINKVYQDKQGYIWIATEYGLNKFDGNNFSTYKHIEGDSESLKHNYVRTIFEDSSENLYIGTISGLMLYNRDTDSFEEIILTRDSKNVYPHITSIIEIHNGDIWLATSGQGIFSAKKGTLVFKSETDLTNSLNSIYLNFIFEDSQHNIWIGSENEGLNCYNPKTKEIRSYKTPITINSNNISTINEDSQGNIYVGTLTKGLSKYDPESDKFHPIRHKGNSQLFIKSLVVDDDDRLYIGTDGQGLMTYNKNKNIIEDYEISSTPFDFSKSKIHSILLDRDKNIWLGFFQKGLFFIPNTKSKFNYFGYKSLNYNIIGSSSVTAIHKDSKGITWIGTDNDGTYGINNKGEQIYHYKKTSSPNSAPDIVYSIHEDLHGSIWLGSYTDGLAKLDRETGNCKYIDYLSDKKVYCITENSSGHLLVGTYGSGFFILDKDGKILEAHESSKREMDLLTVDELANDWINALMCDKDGLIWVGHFKGLSCYDPIKKTYLTFSGRNNILPETVVQALTEDEKGNIWIGTSTGLFMFDKQSQEFTNYTTKEGLANDVICGICEDEDQNIWISTYQGISKLKTDTKQFVNYYVSDGLQGNEFSRGAVFKDNQGKVFFGGTSGVTSFFPKEIIEKNRPLDISLTNFYIYNKIINKRDKSDNRDIVSGTDTERFTLNYNDNTFSFEFSTFDFAYSKRISYQYMIENVDMEWLSTANGVNRITYNNLPPGNYTFKVRANDNGNYSPIKTYQIKIVPPWYKSVWANWMYAILVMLIIYGIVAYTISRIRYKQQLMQKDHAEKVSEAKLQFFINISHEIRTPMTLIINPLEKLIKENKDEDTHKIYQMIHRNSQRILRLINQLMDIRKLDKGQMKLSCRETDVVGFINDLMLTFEYQAKKKNINFIFEHEMRSLMVWIDLNNFDKVLLNILSNAFKYTPDDGEIKVSLAVGGNDNDKENLNKYFEITIADTGIGLDEDKIENIFERFYQINNDQTNSNFGTGIGLHLAKLLVEMHHGILYAENRKDVRGSKFIIRLPLGNAHFRAEELEAPHSELAVSPYRLAMDSLDIPDNLYKNIETDKQEKKVKPKTKYRLLLVEDEDEIRQYIQDELSDRYKILEARNGKEALDIVMKEHVDLIISDVMMPEMDGIMLSRKIKQNININHIPIILLTAKTKPEDKIEGLEIGADAYLSKPFNTDILRQTISNLIENRELLKNKFGGKQHQDDKIKSIELKSSDDILIERIMKFINDNISNPNLNVEMLAENSGISRVHLHRKLKELTSQSARDFIRGIRLKQAASLLTNKKLTVSEVAYAVGFTNLSHFSNAFKEFYGVSPSEYSNSNSEKDKNNT